jgi:hypothetical protein
MDQRIIIIQNETLNKFFHFPKKNTKNTKNNKKPQKAIKNNKKQQNEGRKPKSLKK